MNNLQQAINDVEGSVVLAQVPVVLAKRHDFFSQLLRMNLGELVCVEVIGGEGFQLLLQLRLNAKPPNHSPSPVSGQILSLLTSSISLGLLTTFHNNPLINQRRLQLGPN